MLETGQQLTFFDNNETQLARRRFKPREYLSPLADTLIAPAQEISVKLLLEDPGNQATGYRLDFL